MNHDDVFIGNGACRLCRHHVDVFIVRKHKNGFRGCFIDGVENILHAGIHSLAAVNDFVYTEIAESIADSVSHADRDKAVFLFRLRYGGFFLCGKRAFVNFGERGMLFFHIFDFYGGKHAVKQCLI